MINRDEKNKNQEKKRKENCGDTNASTNTRRLCNFYQKNFITPKRITKT